MSIFSRLFTTGLCLACAHAMVEPSAAQTPEQAPETQAAGADNWYQVHLAVFEHRGGSGEFEEQWRSQLQLTYPEQLIRLKNRERYLSDLCGTPAESAGTEDGDEPTTHYRYPAVNPTHPDCRERRPDLFPEDANASANARAASVVSEAESMVGKTADKTSDAGPARFEPPTPFILADSTDEEFAEMVKKLRGAYRYRVLFASSWAQPLKPRDTAPALLIQGGEEVGKHYQLEGYIKVALERYLHIDTDLWLSDFAELPQWAREQRTQQLMFDEAAAVSTRHNQTPGNETRQQDETTANRISEFPALPLPFPVNDPAHRLTGRPGQPSTVAPGSSQTGSENLPTSAQARDGQWSGRARDLPSKPASNLDLLGAEDSSYYVKRTVVMRQNRRMRSGEVHYIDHPMFGLLVKITPIPAPLEEKNTNTD